MLGVIRLVTSSRRAQFGQAPSVEKLLGSLPVVADFLRHEALLLSEGGVNPSSPCRRSGGVELEAA